MGFGPGNSTTPSKKTPCIEKVVEFKYLGVLFDSILTFENQIQKVASVSYASLRKISSIRNRLSGSNLETLIHAFISSHLDYCNVYV